MDFVRQIIGSGELSGIIDLPVTLRNKKVQIIVLPIENVTTEQPRPQKRHLGFAKGAEIPDSFFEPLAEEELQAWGL